MKIIKVKSCRDCVNLFRISVPLRGQRLDTTFWCEYGKWRIDTEGGKYYNDEIKARKIKNFCIVPSWCPLPDYGEEY